MAEECVKCIRPRPRFLPANCTVSHGSAQEPRDVPRDVPCPGPALHSFDLLDLVPARQIQLFLARRPVRTPAEHFLDSSKIVGLQISVKIVALPAWLGRGRRILEPAQKCCSSFKPAHRICRDDRRVRWDRLHPLPSIAFDYQACITSASVLQFASSRKEQAYLAFVSAAAQEPAHLVTACRHFPTSFFFGTRHKKK